VRYIELEDLDHNRKIHVNPLLVSWIEREGDGTKLHLGTAVIRVPYPIEQVKAWLESGAG